MIVTVTPNPGLDLTYQLTAGDILSDPQIEVHRARSVSLEASGKGVNVSRAMTSAGTPSIAVLLAGGRTGGQLLELLDAEGVPYVGVPQAGATRVNTTVLSPGGPTTKLNAPGAAPSQAEVAALVQAVDDELGRHPRPDWLLVCGSMPADVEAAMLLGRLVEVAHARGWRVGVDSSGAGLRAAFDAGADLLAPNAAELVAVLGSPGLERRSLASLGLERVGLERLGDGVAAPAILAAATDQAARYGCELLVSLGAAGAGWTDGRRTLHARGPVVVPVNSAGAGDALLAGWFFAAGEPEVRLATAVAWGTAACLVATTVTPAPAGGTLPSIESIQVSNLGLVR